MSEDSEVDEVFQREARRVIVFLEDVAAQSKSQLSSLLRAERGMYGFWNSLAESKRLVGELNNLGEEKRSERILPKLKFASSATLKRQGFHITRPENWLAIEKYDPKTQVIIYWEIGHDQTDEYSLAQQVLDIPKSGVPIKLLQANDVKKATKPFLKQIEKRNGKPLQDDERTTIYTDIWEWYSSPTTLISDEKQLSIEVKKYLDNVFYLCTECGTLKKDTRRCACKAVRYCSTECQKKNWPSHKAKCKEIRSKEKEKEK